MYKRYTQILLWLISQALGDYLEKQRTNFPRFYFIGDEDLLEIIGSNSIQKLQMHVKKMFSGIASLVVDQDGVTVTGMASAEGTYNPMSSADHLLGEVVPFQHPINTSRAGRADVWLSDLIHEMRSNLSYLTVKAYHALKEITDRTSLDMTDYLKWIDEYPGKQILVCISSSSPSHCTCKPNILVQQRGSVINSTPPSF